jgi:hypothetical protein
LNDGAKKIRKRLNTTEWRVISMGAPDIPKPKAPPPPVKEVAANPAAEAEKKFLKDRKGGMSQWLTRGQTLGGGKQLK